MKAIYIYLKFKFFQGQGQIIKPTETELMKLPCSLFYLNFSFYFSQGVCVLKYCRLCVPIIRIKYAISQALIHYTAQQQKYTFSDTSQN